MVEGSDAAAPEAGELPAPPVTPPEAALTDGSVRRLDPEHVAAERLAGWIAVAVLGGAAVVGWILVALLGDLVAWQLAGLVAAALVLVSLAAFGAHAWPPLAWRHASYRVDTRGIEIRRGVIWRTVTSVPRARIQHMDVTQGPVQRRFGLATLVLHTAGSENSQVNLEGVARPTALALRDALSGERGDDAV